MWATPAANDTSERMTGIIRPKKLAASPCFAKNPSALSRSSAVIPIPAPALEDRAPAPRPDGVGDERADRRAERARQHDEPERPRLAR